MKAFIPLVVGLVFVVFPFLVHYGLQHAGPQLVALLLFVGLLLRICVSSESSGWPRVLMLLLVSLYCGAIAVANSELLLRYYPVLMSLYVALLFFLSLFSGPTLIEKFAALARSGPPPEQARGYMRNLTCCWVGLLVFNAGIAAFSACCSRPAFWLWYNGFFSYLLLGGFIGAEWFFRQYYRRKHSSNQCDKSIPNGP